MTMQPGLASLEYVLEVAKDWTVARFADAQDSEFVLSSHRFELHDHGVIHSMIATDSAEGRSPLDALSSVKQPTAWTHSTVVTVLYDTEEGPIAREQEAIEVLAMDDRDVLAEVAFIVRILDIPPCLGRFWSAQ
jgi:hypothetical protein